MKPWELNEKWHHDVATRVFWHLSTKRLSLYRLSVLSGVSFYQTDRYLRKGRRMPAYALFRFAQALGVTVSDLVGDAVQPPQQATFDFEA